MIGIIGARTSIAIALRQILPPGSGSSMNARIEEMPFDLPRYLIAMGFLAGDRIGDQGPEDLDRAWQLNFVKIAAFCDTVFDVNPFARICIVTSASGSSGSFDMAYAGSKAAIDLYVRTKRLDRPAQQLVGIAPHIIADAGMTDRRKDHAACMQRGEKQRRGRWTSAAEVAQLAHFLLFVDEGAICNQVIRIDGGVQ